MHFKITVALDEFLRNDMYKGFLFYFFFHPFNNNCLPLRNARYCSEHCNRGYSMVRKVRVTSLVDINRETPYT